LFDSEDDDCGGDEVVDDDEATDKRCWRIPGLSPKMVEVKGESIGGFRSPLK
jgi:hypothetical protein